jgi:hypothetical protein
MHFAEFLQYYSLKRLSILYSPTCVGLSTVFKNKIFPEIYYNIFVNSYSQQAKNIIYNRFVTIIYIKKY